MRNIRLSQRLFKLTARSFTSLGDDLSNLMADCLRANWLASIKVVFQRLNRKQRYAAVALVLVLAVVVTTDLTWSLSRSEPGERTLHYRFKVRELTKPSPPVLEGMSASTQSTDIRTSLSSAEMGIDDELGQNYAHASIPGATKPSPAAPEQQSVGGKPSAPSSGLVASGEGGDYFADLRIGVGESLSSLLGRYNIDSRTIHRLSMLEDVGKYLRNLRQGNDIKLYFDSKHSLLGLEYQVDKLSFVDIKKTDSGYQGSVRKYPVEVREVYAEGVIESSLFFSGHRAGLTDKTIANFAKIFSWDIDFARDLRPGDRFEVLYENRYVNDRFIGSGKILRARIHNRSRWLDGIRYESGSRVDYFTRSGVNLRRAFIRNPLDPALISSNYSRRRWHPVLKVHRPHTGVDYAAPTGTPIRATGYGTVSFRGKKGGYGNTVIITHGERYSTLYAHMSRFVKSVRQGSRVSQGQIIGYVGSTGLSTGPHLHYEFRVKGKHTDPQKVKLPPAQPLRGEALSKFNRHLSTVVAKYASHRDRHRLDGDDDAATLAGL